MKVFSSFFYKGDSIRYSVCYMIGISGLVFFLMNAACIALYEQMEKSANAAVYARMGQTVIWTHCFRERMKKCTKISKK